MAAICPAETLAQLFASSPEKTTAATFKKLEDLDEVNQGNGGVASLVVALEPASKLVEALAGAKAASHMQALVRILNQHRSAGVDRLTEASHAKIHAPKAAKKSRKSTVPVRDDVVRRYLKRLEESLGDDGFVDVYRELQESKDATAEEIVAIAKTFTVGKPKSRPQALQAIWNRHNKLMGVRTKSSSRAGRSGA